MSGKTWIIFGVVCALLFGGLVLYSGRDRIDVTNVNTNEILAANENNGNIADHVYGNKDAKVVLIEYGDFQCPSCANAHPIVKELSEKYEDELAFVYRNFPLTNIHPNARAAAAAAEAAGKDGKYWDMHNAIFEAQDDWASASTDERGDLFASYAEELGISNDRFNSLLTDNSASINRKINFDIALGRKLNVSGTPTFYLNGTKLDDEQTGSKDTLEAALLAEFEKQGVKVSSDEETATE